MIGKVHDSRRFAPGFQLQSDYVIIGDGVSGLDCQISGVSFIAAGAEKSEFTLVPGEGLEGPVQICESVRTSVEMVRAVVDCQLIRVSPEGELSFVDTVRESSRNLSEAGPVLMIVPDILISQNYVLHLPFAVREQDRHDTGSGILQPEGYALRVGELM